MNQSETGISREECSYEDFGVRFFEYAVTARRIESALSGLSGRKIDFGPKSVGAMGIATVSAAGTIDAASVAELEHRPLSFHVTIPVDLDLTIRLAGRNQRFHADVAANLTLSAHAMDPLRLVLHAQPPQAQDVQVKLEARSWGASMLGAMADIEAELRRVVAAQIARRLDEPEMLKKRDIDIAARIDNVMPG